MKVVLAGSTGFLGQEILSQCLSNPSITSVIALSRRDIPISHAKLTVQRMTESEFASFSSPELKSSLRGADACIWSLGVMPSMANSDWEKLRQVSLDYTHAAVSAFSDLRKEKDSQSNEAKKFRFVYVSGSLTERDQNRPLWVKGHYRKVRGETENILLNHSKENDGSFESYILRPGWIVLKRGTFLDILFSWLPTVPVDVLSKASIDIAMHGNEKRMVENADFTAWS